MTRQKWTAVAVVAIAIVFVTISCSSPSASLGAHQCPATPPQGGRGGTAGDLCDVENLMCTYGGTPGRCNRLEAVCSKGHFYLGIGGCGPVNASCTSTVPANGSACVIEGSAILPCPFSRGVLCFCTLAGTWSCNPPVQDARCPDSMPNIGTPCSVEGADCDYGECFYGWHELCSGGAWKHVESSCR
jgi:hypothetical protein